MVPDPHYRPVRPGTRTLNLHPSRAELERYLLNHLTPPCADAIEEHSLACPRCLEELEDLHSFIQDLRAAIGGHARAAGAGL